MKTNQDISLQWATIAKNKRYLYIWIAVSLCVPITLEFVSQFLAYNETRTDAFQINDWLLNRLPATDNSTLLFALTWGGLIFGIPFGFKHPRKAMTVLLSIIIVGLIRCFLMNLIPLEPPVGIIPLRDPILEQTFYNQKVYLRDLFFSGHTANLTLLIFFLEKKWMKALMTLTTVTVAFLLLRQHAHYTLDVVVAPFFAYLSWVLAKRLSAAIHSIVLIKSTTKSV